MALDRFENQSLEVRAAVADSNLSDHELIARVQSGDESGFDEIMNRYRNPLTNFIYRMLGDYEEAVDLAQESFVRVYFALDRYKTDYAFSTYIYRIATNLAITEIRRRRRRKLLSLATFFQTDEDEALEFHPKDARQLPDAEVIDGELKHALERAIRALPEKYRAPIVLRDVQELTYEEVASVLGLGIGTTKSRISRARGLVREKLKGFLE